MTSVVFRYDEDPDTFYVGGHGSFASRKKWRDMLETPKVAFQIIGTLSNLLP